MALMEVPRPAAARAVVDDVCGTLARRAQAGSMGLCPVELTGAFVALCAAIALTLDYSRRARFYREASDLVTELGSASHFPALIDEPDFLEGRIAYQAGAALARLSNNEVSAAQVDAQNYREYVELWIHEIKTPIAAAKLMQWWAGAQASSGLLPYVGFAAVTVLVVAYVLVLPERTLLLLSPRLLRLSHESLDERCGDVARAFGLTEREGEVFALLARGRDVGYIEQALFISRNTVNTHRKNLYRKLGIHTQQELLSLIEDGLA